MILNRSRRWRVAIMIVVLLISSITVPVLSAASRKSKGDDDTVHVQVAEQVVQHSVCESNDLPTSLAAPISYAHSPPVSLSFAVAGKIQPVLANLIITRRKAQEIWTRVLKGTRRGDLLFLVALGWGLVPVVEYPYEKIYPPPVGPDLPEADAFQPAVEETGRKRFRDTILFQIVHHISQVAKVGLAVYCVDVLEIVLGTMGIFSNSKKLERMSEVFAKMAYTVWGAWRFSILKRYLIANAASCKPDKLGRAKILDHLLDVLIAGITSFFLLDVLSMEAGITIKSLFALSSAGTLVFSLASKDLASHVVGGFALGASDKFYEGDELRFSDGTVGIVEYMGLMKTTIRTPDELTIDVPNNDLANQRLVNLSRATKSQVKQTLRFSYDDVDKLPVVLDDILAEIKTSCPALITDGSRPFHAHWSDYKDKHLEVVVQCHFDIKPTGKAYWENKQHMLQAIDRAVKKNDVQFYA